MTDLTTSKTWKNDFLAVGFPLRVGFPYMFSANALVITVLFVNDVFFKIRILFERQGINLMVYYF